MWSAPHRSRWFPSVFVCPSGAMSGTFFHVPRCTQHSILLFSLSCLSAASSRRRFRFFSWPKQRQFVLVGSFSFFFLVTSAVVFPFDESLPKQIAARPLLLRLETHQHCHSWRGFDCTTSKVVATSALNCRWDGLRSSDSLTTEKHFLRDDDGRLAFGLIDHARTIVGFPFSSIGAIPTALLLLVFLFLFLLRLFIFYFFLGARRLWFYLDSHGVLL